MKKIASFIIVFMLLGTSVSVLFNISSAETLPSEGSVIENIEIAISENVPFREKLSSLMGRIRYISGVRHFGNVYIGNNGSLLQEIEIPSSRIFSAAKNYILGFAEKNQTKPYFMLVPTSSVILQQEIVTFANEDIYNQRNMINRMYSEFGGKVRTTDIYQTLYDHRGEYIYYHTKNLPTSLGGYYIYGELCDRLGIEANTLESFSVAYVAHGFYGSLATDFFRPYCEPDFVSLYEYTGKKNKFTVEHYSESGKKSVSENLFIYNSEIFDDKTDMIFGGISPKMDIYRSEVSEEMNSILIFGDESAKSWLPFLVTNYGKITFIDLDRIPEELLSSVSAEDYGQVLFAYSNANFASGVDFSKLEYLG